MNEIKERITTLIAKAQLERAIDELLIFIKNYKEYESISDKVVLIKSKIN